MPSSRSAKCPVRPGEACSLCQPGVTGPHDCGLFYLVMTDPDLRTQLAEIRRASSRRHGQMSLPDAVEVA
jgi:hypothetical protein